MEGNVLKIVGQIAGIGGISLGILLILYRETIRKNIFPTLLTNNRIGYLG